MSWYQAAIAASRTDNGDPEPDDSLRRRVLYLIDGPQRIARAQIASGVNLERIAAEIGLRRRTRYEEHWPLHATDGVAIMGA